MPLVETKHAADEGIGPLVGDIAADTRLLLKQHLDMLRSEVRQDLRETAQGAFSIGGALALALLGLNLLGAMLVGLLAYAVPQVQWWAWAGIVGVVVVLAAGALFVAGKKKITAITRLPEQTVEAAKENIQWLRNH